MLKLPHFLIAFNTHCRTLASFNRWIIWLQSYTWIVPGYLVGGEKRKSEKARLRKGISILIGTPGRLVDHLQNTSCLSLEKVSWLVLDEADRLFDMGYEKDVSNIIATLDKGNTSLLNPEYINPAMKKPAVRIRHTVLLSATLTSKVMELAGLSLTNPVFIDACDDTKSSSGPVPIFSADESNTMEMVALPENLVQQYIVVPAKLRLVVLCAFILWKCKVRVDWLRLDFDSWTDRRFSAAHNREEDAGLHRDAGHGGLSRRVAVDCSGGARRRRVWRRGGCASINLWGQVLQAPRQHGSERTDGGVQYVQEGRLRGSLLHGKCLLSRMQSLPTICLTETAHRQWNTSHSSNRVKVFIFAILVNYLAFNIPAWKF